MAATLTLKDATVARGSYDYAAGASFKPGRTVILYIGGQYAGVLPTGPFGTIPYGQANADMQMPHSTRISAGAKTATAVDATDSTVRATASVTLT